MTAAPRAEAGAGDRPERHRGAAGTGRGEQPGGGGAAERDLGAGAEAQARGRPVPDEPEERDVAAEGEELGDRGDGDPAAGRPTARGRTRRRRRRGARRRGARPRGRDGEREGERRPPRDEAQVEGGEGELGSGVVVGSGHTASISPAAAPCTSGMSLVLTLRFAVPPWWRSRARHDGRAEARRGVAPSRTARRGSGTSSTRAATSAATASSACGSSSTVASAVRSPPVTTASSSPRSAGVRRTPAATSAAAWSATRAWPARRRAKRPELEPPARWRPWTSARAGLGRGQAGAGEHAGGVPAQADEEDARPCARSRRARRAPRRSRRRARRGRRRRRRELGGRRERRLAGEQRPVARPDRHDPPVSSTAHVAIPPCASAQRSSQRPRRSGGSS